MRDLPPNVAQAIAGNQKKLMPLTSQQIIDQLSALGVKAATEGFPEVARAALLRALAEERRPDIVANAANACRLCWRFDEAHALMEEALASAPSDGRYWATKGLLLLEQSKFQEAALAFDEAFSRGSSNLHFTKVGRAFAYLGAGRWKEGFEAYETRSDINPPIPHEMPRWKGESLARSTLLVEAEQGLGDSIMFSRFLDRIEGNYVFSVQAQLLGLFPQARRLGEEVRADYWIPLMSLPTILGADLSYRPIQPRRYLPVETDLNTSMNVGVFWKAKAAGSGGPQEAKHGEQKSCPLPMLLDLATIPGVRLHSLQFGETAQSAWGIINELPIYDFADLASYMSQMDMIVGVDTAPIHLAGMMNRPTLLLLSASGSWQWGSAERSPWYSTLRILRQRKHGEWEPVIAEAKAIIAGLMEENATNSGG